VLVWRRKASGTASPKPTAMGKGKGQMPQFDLASSLTRKETRIMRKMENMIPYWMARCPNYGWKESPEYFKAEELKDKMGAIEAKARKRWESNFC